MEELKKVDFGATMIGDSMVGARINDGDLVLFIKQDQAENGTVVAVDVGGGSLVIRRFYNYPEKKQIVLKADNPRYEPLIFDAPDTVKILGRAVGCLCKIA